MRLTSQNNAFVFSFPRDVITPTVMDLYKTFIDRNNVQYDDVLDNLNSTIKSITFPGLSFDSPEQTIMRGKKINYKDSKNVQDTLNREITITFKDVDSHTNYFMIQHILIDQYLDVERDNYPANIFSPPFILCILDWNRDGVYYLKFDKVVFKSISDFTFDYGDSLIDDKNFSISFVFNYFELEYILTNTLVMRTDSVASQLSFDGQNNINKAYEEYRNTIRNNKPPKTT